MPKDLLFVANTDSQGEWNINDRNTLVFWGYLIDFIKPFKITFSFLRNGFNNSSHPLNTLNSSGISQSRGSFIIKTIEGNLIIFRDIMCASVRASTANVSESYLITLAAERSPNALQINVYVNVCWEIVQRCDHKLISYHYMIYIYTS